MSAYWLSFLELVQILFDFVKSIRQGNWDLHLNAAERMIPWFHAYDRTDYSRHFTYYWASQKVLHETHPLMYDAFKSSAFSTRRTAGKFNMLPPDQVIEQTINKEQKGSGGLIGCSTNTGTVQIWVLSSHSVAEMSMDLMEATGQNENNRLEPKDLGKSREVFDEGADKKML